ncbi:hypothetical protein MASR2M48_23050 [Spirochaetota bacterium]
MTETVSGPALAFMSKIDAIELETESIYLRLGKAFLTVKAAVDSNAHNAELAIEAIIRQHRHGVSSEMAKRRSDEFIEDASRFFDRASLLERTFLSGVEEGMSRLERLDDIIDSIRSDSEEMEIVSLNAMTVALKSGNAGRAFSVITDELKKLSGRTIRLADQLLQAGNALMERLGQLKVALDALSSAQTAFFDAARSALENGFAALDQGVDDAVNGIRALEEQANTVREPISTILQEVQLHDVIRQSLDHVRLSLQAAAGDSVDSPLETIDPDEERAFLARISRLSASLLADISSQVRSSQKRFANGVQGVEDVMEALESSRRTLVADRMDPSTGDGYEAKSVLYISAKEQAMAAASAISEGARQLDIRFGEMHAILTRFKSIVTASRIETARNKALAIVSNTVLGMSELTERLSEDVAAAGAVTRSFGKMLASGLGEYLQGSDGSIVDLRKEISALSTEFDRIQAARTSLWAAESAFNPFSDDFAQAMAEAAQSNARIGVLATEIDTMHVALASYAETADDSVSKGLLHDLHNDRLKSIVDRFTIFAHKQTAASLTNLDSTIDEATVASGEVTLF